MLDGEMTLITAAKQQTYRQGERCDVFAGAVPSVRMGPDGCCYQLGSADLGSRAILFAATAVRCRFVVPLCCRLGGALNQISEISTSIIA
jgi:hypothetical protein